MINSYNVSLKKELESLEKGNSFKIKDVAEEKGSIQKEIFIGNHTVVDKGKNRKKKYKSLDKDSLLKNSGVWLKTECAGLMFFIYPLDNKILVTKNHGYFASIVSADLS